MNRRKIIGGITAVIGAAVFYAAFTDSATEWFSEWITTYAPTVRSEYSSSEMLMAWGGMLAGIGTLLVCKKN